MKKIIAIVVFLSAAMSYQASAQKVLSLDECINIAMNNNIDLKRAQNNSLIARSNRFQALLNFLPDLNFGANYSFSEGASFDGNSGQFINGSLQRSSPGFQSNLMIFNGFSRHYTLKSRDQALIAADNSVDEQKQTIRSNVLGAYLSVVLDKENIRISDDRIKLLESQADREVKRESVGVGNLEQVYNFRSQLANERLNNVSLQNQLQRDMLNLIQQLQLDLSQDYDVAPYSFTEDDILLDITPFDQVLTASLDYSPGLKRATASHMAAKYNYKSAKGNSMPQLTALGQFGSLYSSALTRELDDGSFEQISYWDQIDASQSKSIGFSLTIPIFNNWSARNIIQTAKLGMHNAELDLQQSEQTITNTVQRVYLDLIAAQSTYEASKENLVALNQSYEFVNTRYQNGNTDFYTYLESLNNKNRAEIELVNARYSIIFRKKILDVFQGI